MNKYDKLASCSLQRRDDGKMVTKQFTAKPYSQCTREGNKAFPVFDRLKDRTVEKEKK